MVERYLPIEVPKYYPREAPFLLGDQPSGDVGAALKVDFGLDNFPDHVYGLRGRIVYALPNEFEVENLDFRSHMKAGGTDEGFDIQVTLTQSNITTGWVDATTFWGSQGIHWHALSVPYKLRGGNNIVVEARRSISYPHPTYGDPAQTLNVAPTLKLTLVTGVLISDLMPGSAPGSTGRP